jgi:hypothetical protein
MSAPSSNHGVSRQLAYMVRFAGNGSSSRGGSFVNAIAHLWLPDVLATDEYRARVLGEHQQQWRPTQALLVAVLEDAIKDLEHGSREALAWIRGDWDVILVAEQKFTLADVLAHTGIAAPLDMVRRQLLKRFAIRADPAKAVPGWQRSHHLRQARVMFTRFHQERWRTTVRKGQKKA